MSLDDVIMAKIQDENIKKQASKDGVPTGKYHDRSYILYHKNLKSYLHLEIFLWNLSKRRQFKYDLLVFYNAGEITKMYKSQKYSYAVHLCSF